MKKPDIAKRLLPLLDIMMLLLSFFIILPNGITTNERIQIGDLQSSNELLQQKIDYLKWNYGNRKEVEGNVYKTLEIFLINDEVHFDKEILTKKDWERKIGLKIELENINFILIKIKDTAGEKYTRSGTVDEIKSICRKFNMMFIIETN